MKKFLLSLVLTLVFAVNCSATEYKLNNIEFSTYMVSVQGAKQTKVNYYDRFNIVDKTSGKIVFQNVYNPISFTECGERWIAFATIDNNSYKFYEIDQSKVKVVLANPEQIPTKPTPVVKVYRSTRDDQCHEIDQINISGLQPVQNYLEEQISVGSKQIQELVGIVKNNIKAYCSTVKINKSSDLKTLRKYLELLEFLKKYQNNTIEYMVI